MPVLLHPFGMIITAMVLVTAAGITLMVFQARRAARNPEEWLVRETAAYLKAAARAPRH